MLNLWQCKLLFRPKLLYLLAIFLLLSCAGSDTWQRIQQTATLHIGLDPTYPPFENADSGELIGIDIDLANAIAAELHLTTQFDYIGYDGLYDALLTGRVDLLISALTIDEMRTTDVAFSAPYFNAGQVLIVPMGSSIEELADLASKTVAVELGAMGHVAAIGQQSKIENLTIIPLQTPDEVIRAVEAGSADVAIIDNITARLSRSPDVRIIENPVTVEPFAIVVRVEDRVLLNQINDTLAQLERSGRLAEILELGFAR